MFSNREKKFRAIFYLILFMFCLFYVQQFLGIPNIKKLKGYLVNIKAPEISSKSWFNENIQDSTELFLNQRFGFRASFIRLFNQIDYSLFGKLHARGVVIGKDLYLYEENYINAYYGRDFIGEEQLNENVTKLKAIQQYLNQKGKDFLVVLAAGKASYYPEYIPDNLKSEKKTTNFEEYRKKFIEEQIDFIDFNAWFKQMKDTVSYPLIPKTGIHWSMYGVSYVIDSLIKYIENKRSIDLPDYVIERYEESNYPRSTDIDIERGLNLMFSLPNLKYAYPKFKYVQKDKKKPKVLVVSDSFYWALHNNGFSKSVIDGKFWFYFAQEYPKHDGLLRNPSELNIREELEQCDMVILISTEATIPKLGWGFIDRAYDVATISEPDLQQKINEIVDKIKKDPKWYGKIKEGAKTRGISVDSSLYLNALYVYKMEKKN